MARICSCLCVILGTLALACSPSSSRKVLLVVREGANHDKMVPQELVVMIDTLKAAGLHPVVASLSGGVFVSQTAKVKSDLKFANVRLSDYVAVVVPCMASGPGQADFVPDEAVKITKDAAAAGRPIAAQRSGLFILSRAGLLHGRRYAYTAFASFPEGVRSDDPVVRDGNIITSATCPNAASSDRPDTTVPLIKTLIEALG
jgi:putative intracellular protease/amidase